MSCWHSAEWAGFTVIAAFTAVQSARQKRTAALLPAAVFLLFAHSASGWAEQKNVVFSEAQFSERGMFITHPSSDGPLFKAVLRAEDGQSYPLRFLIKNEAEKEQLAAMTGGMSCAVAGVLKPPQHPVIPNGFDYHHYLQVQGIHYILEASQIMDCREEYDPEAQLLQWRSEGLNLILRVFPADTAGIVQALIFGEREWIESQTEADYQQIGIIHLLAISGMQVALLAAAGRYVLIRAGMSREGSAWVLLCLLPAYLILAGGSESVTRAVLAGELYLLLVILKSKAAPVKLLTGLFLIWLYFRPLHLFLTGFQLTFVISSVLLISAGWLKRYRGRPRMQNFSLTLLSMISTFPLILSSFWELSLSSLFVNFLFVPLYSFFIMPLSLLAFVLTLLQAPFWNTAVAAADSAVYWTNGTAAVFAAFDPLLLTLGKPPAALTLLYTAAALYSLWAVEKGWRKAAGALLIGGSLVLADLLLPYFETQGSVTFLDVGQGDCIVIELPYREGVYVIDTGGAFTFEAEGEEWRKRREEKKLSEYTLLPYLTSKGITKVDAIFLTHADHDHVGEYRHILSRIKTGKLVIPEWFVRDSADAELIKETVRKKTAVQAVRAGGLIKEKGIQFEVLSPSVLSEDKNEDSLVLRFRLGGKWWLLTGDLGAEGEGRLLQKDVPLHADVLKAGHHGSKTSTTEEFLKAVSPETAIISAGRKNRYGHPHPEVLKRLEDEGTVPLRTDTGGTIQYLFSGESGTFVSHPP
nr:DNA internalization-related competence protein ComEC/Rec2 [Metabacillus mangrovi]